ATHTTAARTGSQTNPSSNRAGGLLRGHRATTRRRDRRCRGARGRAASALRRTRVRPPSSPDSQTRGTTASLFVVRDDLDGEGGKNILVSGIDLSLTPLNHPATL